MKSVGSKYVLRIMLQMLLFIPIVSSRGQNKEALATEINGPTIIVYDDAGTLFVIEQAGKTLNGVNLHDKTIDRIWGKHQGEQDTYPRAVATDHRGGLYIADRDGGVQHVDLAKGVREVLIRGTGKLAEEVDFMIADKLGDFYLSRTADGSVAAWNQSSKQLRLVAGTGQRGFNGDGGLAEHAELSAPTALALTSEGDLLIADSGNCRIRKVEHGSGVITTIAGTGRSAEGVGCVSRGDGRKAIEAELSPRGIAVDKGVVFVIGDNRLRKVDPRTGIISTVAGTGKCKSAGDGGKASKASLANPAGIAIDSQGNIYIVSIWVTGFDASMP
ncbi:MAG TPA: hypothetical protein VKZ53_17060 [Candidatus Angelobacter sp.]|nr:hypothetical protein [Candidatus Angelobacter sp.]